MFRIISSSRQNGKLRVVVESDDSSALPFLRLFKDAHKFAELYGYELRTESGADERKTERLKKMEQVKSERSEVLHLYRSCSGTHYERIRFLREWYASNGSDVTLDRIVSKLSLARIEGKQEELLIEN